MGTERSWGRGWGECIAAGHSCGDSGSGQRRRSEAPVVSGPGRRAGRMGQNGSPPPPPAVASMALPSNVHLHPPPVADAEDPHGSRHCSPQRPPVPRLETDAHALPITLKLLLRRYRGAAGTVLVRTRVGPPCGRSGVHFGGSSGSGGSGKDDGGDGALLGNAPAGQRSRVRRRASKRAFMFIDYCHASNFSITQRISTKRATTFWPSASSSPFST